jgi:hypothetical protein
MHILSPELHIHKEQSPSNRMSPVSEQASSRRDPTETDKMATGPRINVHTLLPHLAAAPGGINPNNWTWIHSLTFPLEKLRTLHSSQQSYKWIRFAIGVVTGAEGTLSTSPDSSTPMDYDALLAATDLYYHMSAEERGRIFPIDPSIMRTRITSSVQSDRRTDFRSEVLERDREQCVLTRIHSSEGVCEAAYLIAHSKGDDVRYSTFNSSLLTTAIAVVHRHVLSASQPTPHQRRHNPRD